MNTTVFASSHQALNNIERPSLHLKVFLGCLLAVTAYRWLALWGSGLQLYFDEAYYWTWSRELSWGYYSKPPMIAWFIRLTTSLCGEGEVCIRSGSLLLFAASACLVFASALRLFDGRSAVLCGLSFASLPVVSFYSWLMTTDSLLLFFWALALYACIGALKYDRWGDWLLLGVALGLGLLSKYTMGFFLLSLLLFLASSTEHRSLLCRRKFWTAVALAVLLFLPNLWWNLSSGFASFRHTAEIAHWDSDLFHPDRLLLFLAGQFLLFGPALTIAVLVLLGRYGHPAWKDERLRLLLTLTLPLLALYSLQAFIARANLNWAAAACVPAAILAGVLLRDRIRLLLGALALNLLLGAGVYHYGALAQRLGFDLPREADAYAWMKGWRELSLPVAETLARFPEAGLASDNRRVLSELLYYLEPRPQHAAIWNPSGQRSDQFRLTADMSQSRHSAFILVTESDLGASLRSAFEEVRDLGEIAIPLHRDHPLRYRMYFVRNFGGYSS